MKEKTSLALNGVILALITLQTSVSARHLRSTNKAISLLQDNANTDVFQFLDGVSSITYSQGDTITSAFGYSDYVNNIPMKKDDHIPIGSNSKLYTTVAIYQLYEEGLLDVDADIATMLNKTDFEKFGITGVTEFCPQVGYISVSNACETMTLRQLLSMSSGMYPQLNCNAVPLTPYQCNPAQYFVTPVSLALTVGSFILQPLIFPPGTKYQYSNPNFVLATYFVEKYSGMTFQEYLEKNIFSRIGLNNTYFDFFDGGLDLDPKRVRPYQKFYDNTTMELISVGAVTELNLGAVTGAGGLVSTVQDEAIFYHALFNRTTMGAPLLANASSLDAMLSPVMLIEQSSEYDLAANVFIYFGQGISVVCIKEGCPDGRPDWIQYKGGTMAAQTANVMDYRTSKMMLSQVWTTTNVITTSKEELADVIASQDSTLLPSPSPQFDPAKLALKQLLAMRS